MHSFLGHFSSFLGPIPYERLGNVFLSFVGVSGTCPKRLMLPASRTANVWRKPFFAVMQPSDQAPAPEMNKKTSISGFLLASSEFTKTPGESFLPRTAAWRTRRPHTRHRERPKNYRAVVSCRELWLSASEVQTFSFAVFLVSFCTLIFCKFRPLLHVKVDV